MQTIKRIAVASLLLLLAACSWFESEKTKPLEGERKPILQNEDLMPTPGAAPQLGPATDVLAWPQENGSAIQTGLHANFTPKFKQVWNTTIGEGYDSRHRIATRPIGADGKVYAMDSLGKVTAMDATTGKIIWRVSTRARKTEALAGGLAIDGDKLFVTDGLPEVQALSIQNGGQIWRTDMDAPARAAPTVWGGRVFVTSRGDQAYGIDAATGKILWQNHGLQELAGVIAGASPAADDDVVIIPYMSGEVIALSPGNGAVLWNESIVGNEKNGNLSSLHDLRAPPMITESTIIAANFSSNLMAIERRLGERVWSKNSGGASQPMTLSGDTLFLITVNQQLIAVSKDTGNLFWVQSLLPELDKDKGNIDEIQKTYWYGPLLFGDQLLIISSEGKAELRDVATGAVAKTFDDLPLPAENPIVMNGMVYWTTTSGDVVAFR